MLDNFKLPNLLKTFGDGPAWPVHKAMSIKTWMSELGVEPLYEWSKWVEAVLAAKGGPTSHWTLWLRMGFQLKHICVSRYTSKYFCHYGDMVVTRCTEPEISHQQQQQQQQSDMQNILHADEAKPSLTPWTCLCNAINKWEQAKKF